jgi:acyl-CoA thioester hydrolase
VGEPFRHRLRVRYQECDPQNVVFNANYLAYFDMAITELFREALGGYQTLLAAGIDLVVAEARIRYLAPLRFDDEFEVKVSVAEMGTTSLHTTLIVQHGTKTAAEGELRHVFIDPASGEKAPIPDSVRAGLDPHRA